MMFSRTREITDSFGARLRLSVEGGAGGARVTIDRPQRPAQGLVAMDGYGSEILCAFIMAARIAGPSGLADEEIAGELPARLRLVRSPEVALLVVPADETQALAIPAPFWDRLYVELGLVTAHVRELNRRHVPLVH